MSTNTTISKRLELFHKIHPVFAGFTSDLIFYIAINTVFMTLVKGLSVEEYASLATISSFVCLISITFLYKVIVYLGTTKSIRLGAILMLLANLLLTFSNHYLFFVLAMMLLEISFIFNTMGSVALKNNLLYQHRGEDYLLCKRKESLFYSISTAIIALVSGFLFQVNPYLPMYLGIVVNVIAVILSFFIFDVLEVENVKHLESIQVPHKIPIKTILLCLFLSYAILYGSVNLFQNNAKLMIQETLLPKITPEEIAMFISFIVFISRLVRVFTMAMFKKCYQYIGKNMLLFLSIFALLAPTCILLGFYLPIHWQLKVLLMCLGFFLVLGVREPFNILIQDLALEQSTIEEEKRVVLNLALARKIGGTIVGMLISLLLFGFPLIVVFMLFFILFGLNFVIDTYILKKI